MPDEAYIAAMQKQPTIPATRESQIAKAMRHIRSNISQPLSMEQLASIAGMSRSNFEKEFKKSTNTTPSRYQNNLRIEHAKIMLSAGRNRISEIALACGYYSQPHFNRAFKERSGITPGQFRSGMSPTKTQLCPQLLICLKSWHQFGQAPAIAPDEPE